MQGAAGGQEVPRNSGAVLPRLDPSLLYKVGLVPTSSVIPYALRILPRFLEFLRRADTEMYRPGSRISSPGQTPADGARDIALGPVEGGTRGRSVKVDQLAGFLWRCLAYSDVPFIFAYLHFLISATIRTCEHQDSLAHARCTPGRHPRFA